MAMRQFKSRDVLALETAKSIIVPKLHDLLALAEEE
jgi:hypothetical protein